MSRQLELDVDGATSNTVSPLSTRIDVAPDLLVWARTTIGFTEERAATRIGVSLSTLGKWERGDLSPTLRQLRKAASVYKRPLAVLLLPERPVDFQALRDFRASDGVRFAPSPELTAEYWRALSQRDVLLEIGELDQEERGDERTLPAFSLDSHADDAAHALREWLGVARIKWADPRQALSSWIEATENRSVLVLQTHGVPTREMRGFSVSEKLYPVVALNGSDFDRGHTFTLLHELAHLALNLGGLCDLHENATEHRADDRIERFCNRVAASAIMPGAAVLAAQEVAQRTATYAWSVDQLENLARPFGASAEAFLLRLVTLNKATWDLYWQLKPSFESAYREARERQRESSGGPSFYVVKARDLGRQYVRTVLEAFRSRSISSLDAADYLDVRFDQIPKLEQAAR